MKFLNILILGLLLLVSCNSKKTETEQTLNNKWSSLKQYDLDSNVFCITYYTTFISDEEIIGIRKLYFDKNGLLKTLYDYSTGNDSLKWLYKTTYDYKFTQNGDIDEIICHKSNENDTTKFELYFSNKFVYANDYVIIKSKQHPSTTRQFTNYDGTIVNVPGCQDYSRYELFEYKATILSDNKIRFEKGKPTEFEFIMDTYSLEYIATDSMKIEYYK